MFFFFNSSIYAVYLSVTDVSFIFLKKKFELNSKRGLLI